FTLSASAWFFSSIYYAFFEKRRWLLNIVFLLIASYILLAIKPYIFLMILPGSLIWISYDRITRIRNRVLAVLAVPGLLLLTFGIGLQVIILLNDSLGDYSPDKIIDKAIVTQSDLKREYYGDNSFDIGDIDPSFIGFVSKFPPATLAGLFRPFIWESNNIVMLFSGLENLILLILFALALLRSRLVGLPGQLFRDPMLLFCFAFSVFFAYAIGLTTANFGALVRFKIPLIPFFAASVLILMRSNKRKTAVPQRTYHTLDEEWLHQAQPQAVATPQPSPEDSAQP
ncbi:MAG: hypothetical protein AAGB22_03700, partial [Bacteroidota bacterium]